MTDTTDASEKLGEELARLVAEYNGLHARTRSKAWNQIADFAYRNADEIVRGLAAVESFSPQHDAKGARDEMTQTVIGRAVSPARAVEKLLERGVKISERALREKGRRIGAYRGLGQAMFFLPEDLDRIMEPECSVYTRSQTRRSSSKSSDQKTLLLRAETYPKSTRKFSSSQQKSKPVDPIPFRKTD